MEGWANLGQTGCPETYSPDSGCDQSLSPADVQTTPSTGGRGPSAPPPPQPQTGRRSCHSAGTSDRLQVGITAYSALCRYLLVTSHRLQALRTQQQIPKAEVPRNHQAPLLAGRSKAGNQFAQGPSEAGMTLFITHQDTEVGHHLPLGQSHTTYSTQGSTFQSLD